MEDDIDYGELFGVDVSESGTEPGQEQEDGQTEVPPGGDVPNSDTKQPEASGTVVGQSPMTSPGQEQENGQAGSPSGGSVPESGTEPEQRREPGSGEGQNQEQERFQYEAVIAKAREDAQRTIDEVFARSGMRNPYTGQPITSKAEYDAYKARFDQERREQVLQKTGMSGEEFQRFVEDLPEVRQAREAREAAEKAVNEAREAAAKVKVEEQLREIGTLDPSVKSLEDLAKMPAYPRFYELVKRGYTLTDAFKLVNFDRLTQSAAAGARQAAVNATRSKEHLEQTRSRGTGAVSVPAEVREQYRLFNPDATDEEIQNHYAKSHKKE